MVLSAQPAIIWFWYYWQFFPKFNLIFFIFFPLVFFIGVIILIISAIIIARIFLSIINLIHKPKEGIFQRIKDDKDYCFWSLRGVIRKWPMWLARQLNLPILEKLALKMLGIKFAKHNSFHSGWIDCEFIECGSNIRIGQGSLIMSNVIIQDKLIIKKVVLKDNIIIGAHSVIMPGTIVESNTIIDAITLTKVNQHLEANSIYSGIPAQKVMDNSPIISDREKIDLKKAIFDSEAEKNYDKSNLKTTIQEISVPFTFYIISGWIIVGGSFILPAFLFVFFLFGFLIPNFLTVPFSIGLLLKMDTLIIMILTPSIIIGIYILHLIFIAIITRLFYRYTDKRGPAGGIFDRKMDESSLSLEYYHLRAFLLKYPIFAVMRSPFPWLLNWELNFIGCNKIGRGTVFEECYIHSHINYGKNCYVGTFAHNTNHLVDGVYGDENLTFYGPRIGNNCVFSAIMGGVPGMEMEDNSTMLPMSSTIKFDKLGKGNIYSGFPAKKLNKEEILDIFGGMYDGE